MRDAAPPRRFAWAASRLVHRVVVVMVMVMVMMVMMVHRVVMRDVVMVVVRAGEGRNRDHCKGDAEDCGGERLDQVRLHNVFDSNFHRICA